MYRWNIGSRYLELGSRTLVMGIVNVTPDSFSDGGLYRDTSRAIERALQLLQQGADILDVGGESTRPGTKVAFAGKQGVSVEEELARVLPVIEGIKRERPPAVVSVDTYKADVAEKCCAAGAEIVNDVSGFRWDPRMQAVCARLSCGVILMHMRGRPETWRSLPPLTDPVALVKQELGEIAAGAIGAGIERERIVLDPGFGFGKSFEENYPLLAGLYQLAELGFPILAGISRKSFIGRAMASDGPPSQRLSGSLAAMVISIINGAHIVRVHDVKESVEAARVVDAITAGE